MACKMTFPPVIRENCYLSGTEFSVHYWFRIPVSANFYENYTHNLRIGWVNIEMPWVQDFFVSKQND